MEYRNDTFLRACRRERVKRTPVWIMRQAGRTLPEYRVVRKKHDFLTICRTPELAATVTVQPIDALDVDAAILFADILTPVEGMGIDLEFSPGPVISNPVRTREDVDSLRIPRPEESTPYVLDAIRLINEKLEGRVPLIGFAGSPFTVSAYLVEGGSSTSYPTWRALMYREPKTAELLLTKLAETTTRYLRAQIEAGVEAVQLFESWASLMGPDEYDRFALPYVKRIFAELRTTGVPLIYYAGGGATLFRQVAGCGADLISVDWRQPIGEAWRSLGDNVGIQGNLDPFALFGPKEEIESRVATILNDIDGRPGHVFNLGHGIFPATPWENAAHFVECVHRLSENRK